MLHDNLRLTIEDALSEKMNARCHIVALHRVGGGSINDTYRIETTHSPYFLKVNSSVQYPGMFEAEVRGLEFLSLPGAIPVPEVICAGDNGQEAFLVLEFIEANHPKAGFWESFGGQIAKLHQFQGNYFGLEHENYIGSLVQHNKAQEDWVSFFRAMRLVPQVKMALKNNRMSSNTANQFEKLYLQLPDIFPRERPALLHGDLWSGNFMCGPKTRRGSLIQRFITDIEKWIWP